MDFNSRNGFQTAVWGPPLWHILHIMSFNYPPKPTEKDKQKYYNFLISLRDVLPCVYCRNNFFDNLSDCDFREEVFASRDSFSRFIHRLHNQVNTMLGKPCTDSFEDVRQMYEYFRAGCGGTKAKGATEKGCTTAKHNGVIGKSRCALYILPRGDEKNASEHSPRRPVKMGRSMYVDPACQAIQPKGHKQADPPSRTEHSHEDDDSARLDGSAWIVPALDPQQQQANFFV